MRRYGAWWRASIAGLCVVGGLAATPARTTAQTATSEATPFEAVLAFLTGSWTANLDEVVALELQRSAGTSWIHTGMRAVGASSWGTVVLESDGSGVAVGTSLGQRYVFAGTIEVVDTPVELMVLPSSVSLRIHASGVDPMVLTVDLLTRDQIDVHYGGAVIHAARVGP